MEASLFASTILTIGIAICAATPIVLNAIGVGARQRNGDGGKAVDRRFQRRRDRPAIGQVLSPCFRRD